jgi:hypothetical protein
MPEISVRAMTGAGFAQWQEVLAEAYAGEQERSGNWTPDEALRRARESNATLLPQGRDTPGMVLLTALRPDGAPVGRIWLAVEHPRGTAARSRGVSALELNVFGGNAAAIALYASAGYVVVQQQMRTRPT